MKQIFKTLIATAILLACLIITTIFGGRSENLPNILEFNLIAQTLDNSEVINSIVVKKPDGFSFDETAISGEDFFITATSLLPEGLSDDLEREVYTDVKRVVESVFVDNNGNLILNLSTPYGGDGQTTMVYVDKRNILPTITYRIELVQDLAGDNGLFLLADDVTLVQRDLINPEIDAFVEASEHGINYRYFIPDNADDGEKHPLIIWLHGNGEGGLGDIQNNRAQLSAYRGALAFAMPESQGIFGGAYIFAPQSPDSWFYADEKGYTDSVTAIIQQFATEHNIDTSRIYLYGASAGGYMALRMTIENTELFAALVLICPAVNVPLSDGNSTITEEEILTLNDQKIWLVHSKDDIVVPIETSSDWIANLLDNEIYSLYESVTIDDVSYPAGHESWIYVGRNMPKFNGQSIYEWTAAQSRTK